MKESKEIDLSTVIELYVESGSLDKVASELNCTRQHIHNEISRQMGYEETGGIKKLVAEFYTKLKQ